MGYGSASSSGGSRGDGGSGGAFSGMSGLGLTTPKTWHGTSAFGPAGGFAQGFASRETPGGLYGNFRSPTGQQMNGYTTPNGYPAMSQSYSKSPYPGGYTQPVTAQPLPPPPVAPPPVQPTVVPTSAPPPPVRPPMSMSPYPNPAFAGGWISGPNWKNSPPATGSTHHQNNMGNTRGYGSGFGFSGGNGYGGPR